MSAPDSNLEAAELAFRDALADSVARAAMLLADVHAADAVEWLLDVDAEDRHHVFALLPSELQAQILENCDEEQTHDFVARLDAKDLGDVLEQLPSDEAADVLAEADDRIAGDVLEQLPPEQAEELRQLLSYDADSAGGVMATEFVVARIGERIGDVVKEIRKEGEDAEPDLGVFVLDGKDAPIGYIPDRALLTNSIHTPVEEVMVEPYVVDVADDQEIAAQTIAKYGLDALAVTDDEGALLGVISRDDAADILEEEVQEDFARLTGTGGDGQQTRKPVLRRVRQRMPLMALTVLGGLASAKILALAMGGGEAGEGTQEAILRYLPLIVGLAGNVGIQSSTIFVRGFATGEIDAEREWPVFTSEWVTGSIIGLICGVATWLVATLIESAGPPGLGAAVGVAVVAAVAWAAFLGGLVPIVCRRTGIDPAIVAGPFLIALSDVSGSAIYILVARTIALP